MRVTVIGKNINVTPALREIVEKKTPVANLELYRCQKNERIVDIVLFILDIAENPIRRQSGGVVQRYEKRVSFCLCFQRIHYFSFDIFSIITVFGTYSTTTTEPLAS